MHVKQNKPGEPVSEPPEQREVAGKKDKPAVKPGQPAGKASN